MQLENPGAQEMSPFHEGEQAIQTRLGIRDKMERFGHRFIRNFMPDQHRRFYEGLPFLILGSIDGQGRPWASIIAEQPGFITSPDAVTLQIQAHPLPGDPLNANLHENADIGLLGIELATRRRNRMSGHISAIADGTFAITVAQAFGNCPQYIQKRQLRWLPEPMTLISAEVQHATQLTPPWHTMITQADTLFIASRHGNSATRANQGVDVSHRGGKPGFVRIEDAHTLILPDFAGNQFYNTLGNLLLDDRVGSLFIDFEAGHLLYITGRAEIIWDGDALDAFEGAEQLVRISVDEIVYSPDALPFRWDFEVYSPTLEFTGEWKAPEMVK